MSSEEILTCADSPLTRTSNVLQIPLFILALLFTIQFFYISLHTIEHHTSSTIDNLISSLETQVSSVRALATKLQSRRSQIHGRPVVEEQLNTAMQRVQGPLQDSEAMVESLREKRGRKRRCLRVARGRSGTGEDAIRGSLERMREAMWVLNGVEAVVLGLVCSLDFRCR
jgi:hypothetical protein